MGKLIFWLAVSFTLSVAILVGFGYWKLFELNLFVGLSALVFFFLLTITFITLVIKFSELVKEWIKNLSFKQITNIVLKILKYL